MCNDVSKSLDRTPVRSILPERNMRTRLIIIGREFRKNPSQVLFVDRNQMISALAPDRPDQAFNISVLPGRAERGGPIPNAHRSDALYECATECSVIVADEICRCAVPRKSLRDLPRQPLCRRMRR